MVSVTEGKTGWSAWSEAQAANARRAFDNRNIRLQREKFENEQRLAAKAADKLKILEQENAITTEEILSKERKRNIILAAIERARLKKIEAESGEN